MIYIVPTARVIFIAKTRLDVFSRRQEHFWTCSVFGDDICEMKRVTDQNPRSFLLNFDPL